MRTRKTEYISNKCYLCLRKEDERVELTLLDNENGYYSFTTTTKEKEKEIINKMKKEHNFFLQNKKYFLKRRGI